MDITEIVTLDATRVDAVKDPANGFPILLMKAIESAPAVKETPREEKTVVTDTSTETTGTETSNVSEQDAGKPDFIEKSAVDELIKAAVTEATTASEDRIKAVEARLAEVLQKAVPSNVAYSATAAAQTDARKAQLSDANRFERLAETVSDYDLKNYYKSRATALRAGTGV